MIGLPLRVRPILLVTRMITDRIGFHSVLLPLWIMVLQKKLNQLSKQRTTNSFGSSSFTVYKVKHFIQIQLDVFRVEV